MGRRVVRSSSQDLKKLLLTPSGGRFFRPLDAFDEVYPGVILGDASTALSTCLLKELKVTHVLNAAHGRNDEYYGGFVNTSFSNYEQAGIKFMGIPALDTPSFYLRSYFRQAADFIAEAIRSGGKVLIHCQCGISRSATLVAAYLMIKKGMDVQTALSTIRARRSIFPNQGFLSQLCDYEYELKRTGSLPDNTHEPLPEFNKPLKDRAYIPAFHTDHRPTFTSTKYWPFSPPVTRSGFPVSSAYWDYEADCRSRSRARSMDPSSYRARSASPMSRSYNRPARSSSLEPYSIIERSVSPLSTYDFTQTKPYVRPSYYSRTLPDYYYTTPYLYEPYYYTSRYYSDYDYVTPYESSRYYNRYYSPLRDSYYYYYGNRSPYLSSVYSSYVPLSLRYPYSSYRYSWL